MQNKRAETSHLGSIVCLYLNHSAIYKSALLVFVLKRIYPQLILNRKTFSSHLSLPPWLFNRPFVNLSLNNFAKSETNAVVFKSKCPEICDDLHGFCQKYTDGSKMNNGTAAAAVIGDMVKSLWITSHASIFTAELVALNLAFDLIRRSRRKIFVIFSDPLSGLVAIHNCHLETAHVQKYIINYCQLVNAGKSITLVWNTRS